MKRHLILALSLLLSVTAGAQRLGVREEVRADWNKSSGLDCLLDLSPKALTPVPKGYEAVYISHYGRHGSRYAYTGDAYSIILNMLAEGRKEGNLTARGEQLLADLEPFWEYVQYRVGDLTEIGWNQHQEIARTMVKNYPTVFGKGSSVDACSSPSVRSIMSMSSCCAALSRLAPETTVYEHQGITDVQATRPNQGSNPFKYQGPEEVFPYPESSERFFLRHFPNYKDVLARFFKNPEKGLGQRNPYNVFFHLYMFVAGMNSLPQDIRLDVKDFFTVEEFATLWETDNYERFREYHAYRTPCSSIVDDMVEKATQRLAAGSRGADLRYGHDHVVMALELIMDLDGFDRAPADPDDLVYWFQTFRSPMAANIQFIFFNPKKGKSGDTLVKVLLNGDEAHLGDLEGFPYYRWVDVKAYLKARTDQFVFRSLAGGGWADEAQNAHYAGGKGTKVAPWIIETPEQLCYLAGDLAAGSIRYAKLNADIDLNGIDWTPLNNVEPYNKLIDFDGAGHTISNLTVGATPYASFAGVLYGSMKNVTFEGASIDAGANVGGVVAGYVGMTTDLIGCTVTGVTVKNSHVTGSVNNLGGFIGVTDYAGAVFEDCTIEGGSVVPSANIRYVGGFVANVNKGANFKRCTVKGVTIDAGGSNRVGGFAGQAGRYDGYEIPFLSP